MSKQVVLTDEMIEHCKQLANAKAQAKQWEAIAAEHRERMIELLDAEGANQAVTASGVEVAKLTEYTQSRFDKAAFAAAHPEVDLSQYSKDVFVRKLDVKNV